MNKKANIADGFENLMWLIVGAIMLIIVSFSVVTISTTMETKEGFDNSSVTPFWDTLSNMPVILDWALLLITLITLGGTLILYYRVDMQPFMYVVSWLLTIILIIAIIVIGNALPVFLTAFPAIVAQMLFIPIFIANVHWIALIYFVLALITLHIPK
jgi:hypothetical protein